MAAVDYTVRGTGSITPVATLSASINPGATRIVVSGRSGFVPSTLVEGASIMLGRGEILRITAFDDDGIDVARGCADTVPRSHPVGTPVWFLNNAVGTDEREYVTGETVGVKLLMRAGAKTMSVASAPPNDVQFVGRFIRPYPPGNVLVNGDPWYLLHGVEDFGTPLVLTWAHRDRVLQADILSGHEVGNIGPEPGTTYTVDVLDASDALIRSVTGITGNMFTYGLLDAISDLNLELGTDLDVSGKLTLRSVRDGFDSMDRYTVDFTANAGVIPVGWGFSWAYGFGL